MPPIDLSLPPSNATPTPANPSNPSKPKAPFAPALQQATDQTGAAAKSKASGSASTPPAKAVAAALATKTTGKTGRRGQSAVASLPNTNVKAKPGQQAQQADDDGQLPDLTKEDDGSGQKSTDKQSKDSSKHVATAQTADATVVAATVQSGAQAQATDSKAAPQSSGSAQLKPHVKTVATAVPGASGADQEPSEASSDAPAAAQVLGTAALPDPAIALAAQVTQPQPVPIAPAPSAAPAAPAPLTDASFAAANQSQIVQSIHGQLLPNGGKMQIRLSPPELGDMQVNVQVRDGVISAAFETSNEQATRLVSHNLGQLRSALEGAGVTVEKLQVSQTPRSSSSQSGDSSQDQQRGATDQQSQRDQQRRELLRRMWQKVAGDPLDLVA